MEAKQLTLDYLSETLQGVGDYTYFTWKNSQWGSEDFKFVSAQQNSDRENGTRCPGLNIRGAETFEGCQNDPKHDL